MNRVSNKLIFVNYCQRVLHRPTALASPSPALPYTRWVRHWGGGVWTKSVCVCVCVCVCVRTQPCPTLCDPMDCSYPCFSVHGILQARILPFPSPRDLPDPVIKLSFLASPSLEGVLFYPVSQILEQILMHVKVWEPLTYRTPCFSKHTYLFLFLVSL